MEKSYSNKYTYSICEKCKAANCCAAFAIPLTGFDIIRYATALDITPKEFMLKYTVDSFEDMDFIKTNEYIQKCYKDEKVITFLARRIPYINKTSFCIFTLFDKQSGAMRCATYNCRSFACRSFYADDCMEQYGLYSSVVYSEALSSEELIEPYFESEYAKGLYNLSKHSYNARKEFKKGFAGYKFDYDIKKYQLDINEKLLRLEEWINFGIKDKDCKDWYLNRDMINYPEYIKKVSARKNYKAKSEFCWDAFNTAIHPKVQETNLYIQPVIKKYRINPDDSELSIFNGLRFIDSYIKYFPILGTEKDTLSAKTKAAKLLNKALSVTSGNVNKYIKLIASDFKKDLKSNYPLSSSSLMKLNKELEKHQKNDGSWRGSVKPSTDFREKTYLIFCETISAVCYLANEKTNR